MNFIVIGINHKNTPIEVRERFYLSDTQQDLLLSELKSQPSVIEAFVLSTCNRVEIYANILEGDKQEIDILFKSLFSIKGVPVTREFRDYFYSYAGDAAIHHLFKVATSLDSMVIGEKQIIGQLRLAFERAKKRGMMGKFLNVLSNMTLRTGKKAQHETAIGQGGSSVSWAAIATAEEALGTLKDKSILIIGAGKMSELAVGQIQNKGFSQLYLMNRTIANAEHLAVQYGGTAVGFCDIKEILTQVDVCICSVGAPHYILDKSTVENIMRSRGDRPLVIIDISVPRNVDPLVREIEHVLSFQIDDLEKVVDANMKQREKAIGEVEDIIAAKLNEYQKKIQKIHTLDHGKYTNPQSSTLNSVILY
ncbi:MAG: glutamyl-tRNA reductase [Omnitrophica WOR_2 bacterium GWA2_45_18]|nr:MAG: glutamyl-tRNA reductase [Omnitrophica WOR_2 bacterium GWA2_45_18]